MGRGGVGSCRDGVGHVGVGVGWGGSCEVGWMGCVMQGWEWVMQGCGGSCGGVGWVMQGWGEGGVGHAGVGWVM